MLSVATGLRLQAGAGSTAAEAAAEPGPEVDMTDDEKEVAEKKKQVGGSTRGHQPRPGKRDLIACCFTF